MKIALLIFISLFAFTLGFAQKIEISLQANTGAYHYSGASAVAVSSLNESGGNPSQCFTNNPYGSKSGFSYGAGIQAQHVSTGGFITGLQAGFDVLRSREDISTIIPPFYNFPYENDTFAPVNFNIPAKGTTYLQNESVNLSPYIGYRLKAKKIKIDLMPGIDFAFNLSSYDKGKALGDNGTLYKSNQKLPDAPTDVRLKFGVACGYKKWGITAGYAHGLRNLYKGITLYGTPVVHSELLRFGITYRIL